jgi:hypothetical protein
MPDKDINNEKLDEELVSCLKWLVKKYEDEDSFVRKQQIKLWKKNDEFWHSVQYIFWSESKQDWTSAADFNFIQPEEGREEVQGPFYDYVVNIYKAHGESIISALSAQIPAVRFPPDDADDDDDLTTSKTYDKIADLIQRHNKAKMVLLKALFMLWNQGSVFAYHAPKADKAFGSIMIPQYKKGLSCENCQTEKPVESDDSLVEGTPCPTCGGPLHVTPILDGFNDSPKSRVLCDIYGPLNVKVSYYARNQKECGYLILMKDEPRAFLRDMYPHIKEKIEDRKSDAELYERTARTPSAFSSQTVVDENHDLITHKRCWLKPWAFEALGKEKEEEKKKLKKLFPNGVMVAFAGEIYAQSRDEDFNKYWTIGQAGLCQFIHSDALGQPLIPIQELTNVLTNLTIETTEHGIPSGFADPDVLDFDVYSKHEARPGMIYPARHRPGEKLSESFYESARATLSKEVPMFAQQLEKFSQFVVGSFPSIYGGPGEGKSRTAAEYNMSRQMALQRLSIAWTFVTFWWAEMMEKMVHIFVENMVEDEKFVKKENNNYINVWIRRSELTGHVGEVEPEGAETFPISTPQKQALLMKLIEMKDDVLHAAIFDTQNRKIVADALSFPEFEIPGEDQRIKQSREIQSILQGEDIQIEPDVDDHQIHKETLVHYMVSALGLDVKRTNPQGYQLLLKHLSQHAQALAQAQNQQMQSQLQAQKDLESTKGDQQVKAETVRGKNQQDLESHKHQDQVQLEVLKHAITPKKESKNGNN